MSSAASKTKSQYRLLVLTGPAKGTAYDIRAEQVRIGREADNDIVITDDPRLSRHHAMIEIQGDRVEVIDVSQKNKITVNDQTHDRARLQEGMSFKVGGTEMRLERVPQLRPHSQISIVRGGADEPAKANPTGAAHATGRGHSTPRPVAAESSDKTFFIVVIVLLMALGGYFLLPSQRKGTLSAIRSDQDIESTVQESQKKKESFKLKAEKLGADYQDAQALYVQGFRDYKKGQFNRAIDAFRGALVLAPDHVLAQRYLALARRRLDEVIQYNMVLGRQLRSRGMYERCAAAFSNVINLSPDRNTPAFREAQELLEECRLLAEGRY